MKNIKIKVGDYGVKCWCRSLHWVVLVIILQAFVQVCEGQVLSTYKEKTGLKKISTRLDELNISPLEDSLMKALKIPEIAKDTAGKWELHIENNFIQDTDSTYLGEGFFSDYSISRKLNLMGIPLQLEGHLVLQNSTINKRFSGFSIGFDAQGLTQQLKEKVIRKDIYKKASAMGKGGDLESVGASLGKKTVYQELEKLKLKVRQVVTDSIKNTEERIYKWGRAKDMLFDSLDKMAEPLERSEEDTLGATSDSLDRVGRLMGLKKKIQRSDSLFQVAQKRVSTWKNQVSELETWTTQQKNTVDGLGNSEDFLLYLGQMPEITKTAPAGLDTLIGRHLNIDSIFNVKKYRTYGGKVEQWNDTLQKAQAYHQEMGNWLEEKRKTWDSLSDPDVLRMQVKESNIHLSPLQKMILGFQKLNIGTDVLNDSRLTLAAVPINGINTAWALGRYHCAVAIGKEASANNNLATDFARNTNRIGLNRKVVHLKAGVGSEETSNMAVSFTHIKAGWSDELVENPTPTKAKNILVGLTAKQYIGKSLFVGTQMVLSNTDMIGASTVGNLLESDTGEQISRSALEYHIGYHSKKSKSTLETGYSYIGGGYQTLGNPFLITNRNDASIKLKQKLLKERLSLVGEFRINISKNNGFTPETQQNLYTLDASYRINKKGARVWLKYQPMTFAQKIGETANAIQLNTAILGIQAGGKLTKRLKWNTVWQAMNFRQESSIADTALVTGREYLTGYHTLIGGKWMLGCNHYGGFERGELKEGQLGLTATLFRKAVNIETGLQVLKRPFDLDLRYGATWGFTAKLRKWGDIGIRATWLRQLGNIKTNENNGFYGNSTVRMFF